MEQFDIIIIGGGAAGIFAALAAKQKNPEALVLLLERSNQLLTKVRISGGGRCNVTHSCFDPQELIKNYPRGQKALVAPFTRFQPLDTVHWFTERGVELKTEEDGRIFPTSDSSQTVIRCLLEEANLLKVDVRTKQMIESIEKHQHFRLTLKSGDIFQCKKLLLATGSSPQGYVFAKQFGHTIKDPVPSLFTFNIPSFLLADLSGISVERVKIELGLSPFYQFGPLLITHWGFSGPCVLKLSAWAARFLHEKQYRTKIFIDWIPSTSHRQALEQLQQARKIHPNQHLNNLTILGLPKNLWKKLVERIEIGEKQRLSEFSNQDFTKLCDLLKKDTYEMEGKTTHKDEFVTCGGVCLDEISFKTMESKLCEGLYFAGEILDVDGVTGGFNFQNAWTSGFLAGNDMVRH